MRTQLKTYKAHGEKFFFTYKNNRAYCINIIDLLSWPWYGEYVMVEAHIYPLMIIHFLLMSQKLNRGGKYVKGHNNHNQRYFVSYLISTSSYK